MDTKALRQKILDLAIRGKLVPQDPSDEPASVLLEKIREEKARMVKEGKLKKKDIKNDSIIYVGDDNLHYEKFQDGTVKCIEDEIPFEIPDGWVWTRLGNLCAAIQYGLSNSAEPKGSHKFLRITDIQNGMVNWDAVPFTSTSDPDVYLLKPGDIVFARTGATVGKSFLITETPYPSVYASYLIRIRLLGDLPSEYIYQFFDSACYWSQITDKSVGVGQPNCNGTALKELFIPLPPINEQLRIIPTVRKLLKHVTKIDTEEKALMSIVNAAKAKILDLAIRGKLVTQNPDDEPASALLERIRTEKDELIKQGKIKRDKKESFIFKGEDNSYYLQSGELVESLRDWGFEELPDTWSICCLGELCDYGNCINVDAANIDDSAWMLDLEDIEKDTGIVLQKIRKAERNAASTKHLFHKGQVLYSKLRPYLNKVVLADEDGYCTSEILPLEFERNILPQYARYYLMSPAFLRYANKCSYGVKMPRLGTADGKKAVISIPPLDEQVRIVATIEQSFAQLNSIVNNLS